MAGDKYISIPRKISGLSAENILVISNYLDDVHLKALCNKLCYI